MRLTDNALRDCSRAWLEAAAETIEGMIALGYPLQWRLDELRAALANNPPDYDIDHRDRDCGRK